MIAVVFLHHNFSSMYNAVQFRPQKQPFTFKMFNDIAISFDFPQRVAGDPSMHQATVFPLPF